MARSWSNVPEDSDRMRSVYLRYVFGEHGPDNIGVSKRAQVGRHGESHGLILAWTRAGYARCELNPSGWPGHPRGEKTPVMVSSRKEANSKTAWWIRGSSLYWSDCHWGYPHSRWHEVTIKLPSPTAACVADMDGEIMATYYA